VLIGIAVSAGLAALVAIVSGTKVLLGVCIGLVGTLLTVLYDMDRRMERRADADDQRSALLAASLDGVPWLLKELRDIATSARSVRAESSNARLSDELMQAKVGETKAYMQDLMRGHIRVPVGDVTPMSNQIDLVDRTVLATTIPEADTDWWLSVGGRDYLERNRRARVRRVSIERIVLWEDGYDDEATERLAQVIAEQIAADVRLLFAKRSTIPDKKLKTNVAIYDESTYNEVIFNSDGEGVYVEYYLDPTDAKQAVARFEQLRGYATEKVPEHIARLLPPPDPTPPEPGA
jgi:hypothetical protein